MPEIESETKFIWKLLWHIIATPFTLILMLFKRKTFKDLLLPFFDLVQFVFQAKFTISVILINTIIFIISSFAAEETIMRYIFYPSDLLHISKYYTLFTAGFIHSGISHLFFNCIAIFIFGRVVEHKIGFFKTMIVYFIALIMGSVTYGLFGLIMQSNVPGLGASGALMGLVSAAVLLAPFSITYELLIPLPIMIDGWLAMYADVSGLLGGINDGVGRFAHLGGYLSITLSMFLIGSDQRDELKKGLIINLLSIGVLFIMFMLIGNGFLPTPGEIFGSITEWIKSLF